MTRFHKYVYAREFRLVTDHKPLIFLFKENQKIPEMGASRIVRWAIKLSSYQYKIEYRSTTKHSNADMCSRYPLEQVNKTDQFLEVEAENQEVADIFFNSFIDKPVINSVAVKKGTVRDQVLSEVIRLTSSGWPANTCTQGKTAFETLLSEET